MKNIGIRNPKKIEMPPNLTNGLECCFLKFGLSKIENLMPNLLMNGTDKYDIKKEDKKVIVLIIKNFILD